MTKLRATTYIEARSERKEKGKIKPGKIRSTMKVNKEVTKAMIAPRTVSRELKPHKSASTIM